MNKVCISIESLYDEIGEQLTYGTIQKTGEEGNEYFDFYNNNEDIIACMDGEEVYITYEDDRTVELLNKNGEVDTKFKLTRKEFEIATYWNN